jgi:hypothetical protein
VEALSYIDNSGNDERAFGTQKVFMNDNYKYLYFLRCAGRRDKNGRPRVRIFSTHWMVFQVSDMDDLSDHNSRGRNFL